MLLVQALAKLLPRQQCAFLSRGTRRLTVSLSGSQLPVLHTEIHSCVSVKTPPRGRQR